MDDLQLNIFSSSSGSYSKAAPSKPVFAKQKVEGKILARRKKTNVTEVAKPDQAIKKSGFSFLQPSTEEAGIGVDFDAGAGAGVNKTRGQLQKAQKQAAAASNRTNNKPVISSLFNKNPEIPIVEEKDIQQIEEEVFSKKTFSDLDIHDYIKQNLEKELQLEMMTEVQSKAIPQLLEGCDALIQSQTGSGKTLAYAIPIIQKLQERRPKIQRGEGVHALVILPTRELVLQTYGWFQKLSKSFTWLVPGYLIGGEKKKSEKARLRKGITILIATPGRLIDHLLHTKSLSLSKLQWLILDEADKMLDEGYEQDISDIIVHIGGMVQQRQTVLLSATMSRKVEHLAGISLRNPRSILISGDSHEEQLIVPKNLHHSYVVIPAKIRLVALIAFVLDTCARRGSKTLIFVATQDMVDFFSELLSRILKTEDLDIEVSRLHGNMQQKDRSDVFKRFKEAKTGVLFCTDVAARGLDLPKVTWILQFNPPSTPEEYVHRVGRTARVGTEGSALIFLLPSEASFVTKLSGRGVKLMEMQLGEILSSLPESLHSGANYKPPMEKVATELQKKCEECVNDSPDMHEQASKAYISFVRFYATYPKEHRDVFLFKALHLGHQAKAFALRDPPKKISGIGKVSAPPVKRRFRADTRLPPPKRRRIRGPDEDNFEVVPVAALPMNPFQK